MLSLSHRGFILLEYAKYSMNLLFWFIRKQQMLRTFSYSFFLPFSCLFMPSSLACTNEAATITATLFTATKKVAAVVAVGAPLGC